MRHLFRVELTRLRWRRAVLALVALAFVITAVVLAAEAYQTRQVSAAETSQVLTQPGVSDQVDRCERKPQNYGLSDRQECAPDIAGQYVGRSSLSLVDIESGALPSVVTIVALLMALLGTSFAGHDWNSGSMSNQLLFDPRRGRVWAAKATAVTLLAVVVSAVTLSGFWLALVALARHRGLRQTPHILGDGLAECARSSALVGAVALGCLALAMLLRSTVATLAVAFAVAIVGGGLLALLGGEDTQPWQPQNNVAAVVTNDLTYYTHDLDACGRRQPRSGVYYEGSYGDEGFGFLGCERVHHIHALQGSLYLGAIVVVVGGLSVVSFRRRDLP